MLSSARSKQGSRQLEVGQSVDGTMGFLIRNVVERSLPNPLWLVYGPDASEQMVIWERESS